MLDELNVSNLGLIDEVRLEPGPGLVVITGETGTGKTLLLGALRLLRGEAARRDRIGPHRDEAVVEARFVTTGDDEVVASRRVTATRSRAYLDGHMTTATELGARVGRLVELVAQHEHQTLTTSDGVRRLVDGALDADGKAALAAYDSAWSRLRDAAASIAALGGDPRALNRELEMARFQAAEIFDAGFTAGDDERLRSEAGRLRHGAEIGEAIAGAGLELDDSQAGGALSRAADHLRRAAELDPAIASAAEQVGDVAAVVAELATDVARLSADAAHEPGDLRDLEDRIASLGTLQRKYGSDLDEVLAFGERAASRVIEIEELLDSAEGLEAESVAARAAVDACGSDLTMARRNAAASLCASAVGHLEDLGFSAPVVAVALDKADPGPHGTDRVTLTFASSAALTPGPVSRVASGGELSRLVLALRLAAGVADAPIIAFDEIDAGIGGATALAAGRKLAKLAGGRQVFAVTHLPQVAAFADSHYVVERSGDRASVRLVEDDDRLEELTRMLGGLPESERGREHAAELLALGVRK